MKIENYRECGTGEKQLAFFDLYLPKIHLTFRNIKLCQSKQGNHFLGWPSFLVSEDDLGKKQFCKYYEFSQDKQNDFENQIFEALGPFVRGPIVRYRPKQ